MKYAFIEAPAFTQAVSRYFRTDDDYARFQVFLAKAPLQGDVVPGCGGLRKVRWEDARRGIGKRGGLRVIYLCVPAAEVLVLVAAYRKGETEAISADDRKALKFWAEDIRQSLGKRRS